MGRVISLKQSRLLTVGAKPEIIRTGVIAEYHFDEGQGDRLYDHSGNGNHGTLSGPTWTTQGLHFSADDYVDLGKAILTGQPYSAVCAITMPAPAATMRFWGNTAYCVGCSSGRNIWANHRTNTTVAHPTVFVVNQPFVVTVTWDGTTITVYHNLSKYSEALAAPTVSTENMNVGRRGDADSYLTGTVCWLQFLDRAVTDEEVRRNQIALRHILAPRGVLLAA